MLQAVQKLQEKLRKHGSDLLLLRGKPEVQIPALVGHVVAETAKQVKMFAMYDGHPCCTVNILHLSWAFSRQACVKADKELICKRGYQHLLEREYLHESLIF